MQTVWPFPQGSFFSSPFCSALFQISFAAQFQSPFLYTNQQLIHSFADQGMSSPPLASIPPSLPAAQSSYSRVSPLFSFLSLSLYVLPPVLFGCWLRGIIMVCIHSPFPPSSLLGDRSSAVSRLSAWLLLILPQHLQRLFPFLSLLFTHIPTYYVCICFLQYADSDPYILFVASVLIPILVSLCFCFISTAGDPP